MKIVKPYATMLHRDTQSALQFIEWCGRISHRSEDQQGDQEATRRFLTNVVMRRGDWSITEHVSCSVDFYVDRGITHELVRHRLASYTQESTRFVNYEKGGRQPEFIYPIPELECAACLTGDLAQKRAVYGERLFRATRAFQLESTERYTHPDANGEYLLAGTEYDERYRVCPYKHEWLEAVHAAALNYRHCLADGWRPQEARSVLPNALASRIVMTCNLRQWRHFFLMRTTKEAHPQMRQVTIPLLSDFQQHFPVLFDDIQPNERQVHNLSSGR